MLISLDFRNASDVTTNSKNSGITCHIHLWSGMLWKKTVLEDLAESHSTLFQVTSFLSHLLWSTIFCHISLWFNAWLENLVSPLTTRRAMMETLFWSFSAKHVKFPASSRRTSWSFRDPFVNIKVRSSFRAGFMSSINLGNENEKGVWQIEISPYSTFQCTQELLPFLLQHNPAPNNFFIYNTSNCLSFA